MAKAVQRKDNRQHIPSDERNSPQAAARRRRALPGLAAKIGLAVLLGMLASACDSESQPATTSAIEAQATGSPAQPAAAPADDCSTQADRETFIEQQIAQGHWQKVGRVARLFHVHVTPAFLADLSPDEQQQALAVVSAYSRCEGGESRVLIHDATSGEQIGQFSDAGLVLE